MIYAGIGSRKTPGLVLREMENIGMRLALKGFSLRSGGAEGADSAFAGGAAIVGGSKVIRCATMWQPALDHAAQYHPNWAVCDETARGLHARNSLVMLGGAFNEPVDFVVCWTEGGAVKGGTGQALRIAAAYEIPVFNLAVVPVDQFWEWIAP